MSQKKLTFRQHRIVWFKGLQHPDRYTIEDDVMVIRKVKTITLKSPETRLYISDIQQVDEEFGSLGFGKLWGYHHLTIVTEGHRDVVLRYVRKKSPSLVEVLNDMRKGKNTYASMPEGSE